VQDAVVGGDDELLGVHGCTALISCEVEPITSACATTLAGDSGCTSTFAPGYSAQQLQFDALNSSCTRQEPCHSSMSAPVCFWM
jgi:hypothetical protein